MEAAPTVNAVADPSVGTVLVTASGQTLYQFTGACTGGCLAVWRPLVVPPGVAAPIAGSGVTGLGVVNQNGVRQVAYLGHPLYTFTGDSGPRQMHGNGVTSFGGHWSVVVMGRASAGASGGCAQGHCGGGSGY